VKDPGGEFDTLLFGSRTPGIDIRVGETELLTKPLLADTVDLQQTVK
jgi:hypothetical protein